MKWDAFFFGLALIGAIHLLVAAARLIIRSRRRTRRRVEETKPEQRPDFRLLPGGKRACPRCGAEMYVNPASVGACDACHEVAFERKVREDKAQFRAMGFADQDEADRKLKASIERKLLAIPPSKEGRVILFDDDEDKEAG